MQSKKPLIAIGLIAAVGLLIFFLLKPKKAAASDLPLQNGNTGWRPLPKQYYTSDAIKNMGTSITDQGNREKVTLGSDVAQAMFGSSTLTNVFIPKKTGVRFNAAPELLAKLKAKYGEGELFQKGKNLTDGFEWVTNTGTTQLSFKDFMALK